jgi:hypothetical protein
LLKLDIALVFIQNFAVYGVRKVWRQMMRRGFPMARCTVARQMRGMDLAVVIRDKAMRTTISDKAAPCHSITPTVDATRQHRTCCG